MHDQVTRPLANDDASIIPSPGKYAVDVYEHEGEPDDVPKGASYLGCFADDPSNRALTLRSTSSSKMDYDVRKDPIHCNVGRVRQTFEFNACTLGVCSASCLFRAFARL